MRADAVFLNRYQSAMLANPPEAGIGETADMIAWRGYRLAA
jgi:hypothetical protein